MKNKKSKSSLISEKKVTKGESKACHGENEYPHPDHQAALNRLRRIRGQVEGIERMILDRRYCPEILIQFQAVHSALTAVEAPIFEKHLRHCVAGAIKSKDSSALEEKVTELLRLFSKQKT